MSARSASGGGLSVPSAAPAGNPPSVVGHEDVALLDWHGEFARLARLPEPDELPPVERRRRPSRSLASVVAQINGETV